MTTITNSIRIQAPMSQVWSTISDLGGVFQFHPGVHKSYYTTDQKEGIGASRICELLPMGKVEETALAWEDGRSFSLSVIPLEKAPPFKDWTFDKKVLVST
jgi:hypothetical protein